MREESTILKQEIRQIPFLLESYCLELNHNPQTLKLPPYSRVQLHWHCSSCGYQYQRSIATQFKKEGVCPRCEHRKQIEGRSLRDTHPELAVQLVDHLNNGFTAIDVTASSHRELYWNCCSCGESILSSPVQRVRNRRCAYCTGKKVTIQNSLATLNPLAAKEWNFKLNKGLSPLDVTANSNKEYWFTCSKCDHTWLARCNARTSGNSGCPECAKKRLKTALSDYHQKVKPDNILKTHPHLASEWHFEKNAPLNPESIRAKSNREVWWICSNCSHVWQQQVVKRTSSYKWRSCPCCQNQL